MVFRLFVLVLGSILIGTNMFSTKKTLELVLYCFLILAVIALLAIQIALYFLQENYIDSVLKENMQKDSIIQRYVDLVTEYKVALRKKRRKSK